jgi:hypothetical protein
MTQMLVAKDVPTYFNPSPTRRAFFIFLLNFFFFFYNKKDNIKSIFKEKKKIHDSDQDPSTLECPFGLTILETVINETKKGIINTSLRLIQRGSQKGAIKIS